MRSKQAAELWLPGMLHGESRELSTYEQLVAEVYELLRDPVYRYLVMTLGGPDGAEDLVQEAFLRLLKNLRDGGSIRDVRAWVFRVAHNLAMDTHRRPVAAPPVPPACDPGASAEQVMAAREEHAKFQARLAQLAARERQCLELRAEGLRYREIAEVLGIGIPTVQTFLSRAVKKLRDAHD